MADLQNKLTGNYYIVWLSRCDDAWRRRIDDQGPYVPQHTLKKQHHADCQQIAKDLLREQLHDKMQAKRLGLKSNPGKRHSAGFASRAQQRWAFGTGQSFARKWARKTKFKGLPERVKAMKRRRNAAGPSQKDLYYGTVRKQGDADALFMDFVREGMTREELAANIKRRPALWGRYSAFLSKLPSSKRNPRRYRRNVRHGHHRHHSALSKRGLMTKRERRRFTKRMKRHHRVLRLKYREKFVSRRKGSR